jgi:hypothetical protein
MTAPADPRPRTFAETFLFALTCFAVLATIGVPLIIPQAATLFQELDLRLPFSSALVLRLHPWLIVSSCAVALAAVYVTWREYQWRPIPQLPVGLMVFIVLLHACAIVVPLVVPLVRRGQDLNQSAREIKYGWQKKEKGK